MADKADDVKKEVQAVVGPLTKSMEATTKAMSSVVTGVKASVKGMASAGKAIKGLPDNIKNMTASVKAMPGNIKEGVLQMAQTTKEIGAEVAKVGTEFKGGLDKSLKEQAKVAMGGSKNIQKAFTKIRDDLVAQGVDMKQASTAAAYEMQDKQAAMLEQLKTNPIAMAKATLSGIGPAIKSIPGVFGKVMEKIKGEPDAGDKEKENEEARGRKGIMGVLGKIDAGIMGVGGALKKVGGAAKGGIKSLKGMLGKTALALAIPALMLFMNSPYFDKLASFVKNDLIPGIKNIYEMIKPIAIAIASWIADSGLPIIMTMLIDSFKALTTFFSDVFARFSGWSDMSLREKIGAVLGIFTNITELVGKLVGNIVEAIANLFGADGAALRKKYWDPIAKFFTDIVDSVMLIFTDPVAGIKKLFATLWDATKGIGGFIYDILIKPAWNWIKGLFGFGEKDKSTDADTTKGVSGFISDLVTGIWTWFKSLFDFSTVESSFASILNLITLVPNIILGLVTGIWGWIKGLFGFETKDTDDAGAQTKPGGIGGMLLSLVTGVWTWFKGLFSWGSGDKKPAEDDDSKSGVLGFLKGLVTGVWTWFKGLFSWGSGDKKPAEDDDSKSGVLGFLTGLIVGVWEWFKGLFDFSSVGAGFASIVNLITLPHQIIFNLVMGVWKWFKGLFGFDTKDTEAAGVQTTPGGIGGILLSLITGVWTWFKGLFGWGTEDEKAGEGFSVSTLISGVFTSIKEWFGKLFKFDSAGDVVKSIVNVLTFVPNMIKDLIGSVGSWLLGLFGFGEAAKKVADVGKFSIGDLVFKAIEAIGEWFKGLFDIDWAQAIKDLAPDWIKDVPIIGKWFGGGDVSSESVGKEIEEHGQTLKAATESGLYDKDYAGASEINKEALQLGVESGQVQKEMLQAIIDDEDLRKEDLEFMKKLVEQATKKGSLYVHDIELGKLIKEGNDFMMNAHRLNAASNTAISGGGTTVVNNTSVVAPMSSSSSAVSVGMPIGASDPFTNATRSY